MTKEDKIRLAIRYAEKFVGKPYVWGGDDPVGGFDCSGLVIEVLRGLGLLPGGYDDTASGLCLKYFACKVEKPYAGCLVFYGQGTPKTVSHVALCVNEEFCIQAGGGGSATKTVNDAERMNAFVMIRPIFSRKDVYCFVDPFEVKTT